jgi:hypothetical protein
MFLLETDILAKLKSGSNFHRSPKLLPLKIEKSFPLIELLILN